MECLRKLRESIKPSKLPENVDDGLETLEEYNKRWVSVRVIYFTMFLMSLAFSIILTAVWPFLDKIRKPEKNSWVLWWRPILWVR